MPGRSPSVAAPVEVAGQEPSGAGGPDHDFSEAAFADYDGSFAAEIAVLDVEGEDLVGSGSWPLLAGDADNRQRHDLCRGSAWF